MGRCGRFNAPNSGLTDGPNGGSDSGGVRARVWRKVTIPQNGGSRERITLSGTICPGIGALAKCNAI